MAYSISIYNVDELNTFLKQFKSKHPTARHFCWAYRITENDDIIENSSDAGEPSGSGGITNIKCFEKSEYCELRYCCSTIFWWCQTWETGIDQCL